MYAETRDGIYNMRVSVTFDASYYPIALLSCLFFLAVFKYVSPWVSVRLFPKLETLPEAKQIYWHTSVCSSVHAVITSYMCVYALIYENELSEDPIWNDSMMVKSSCGVVIGYMAADTFIMLLHYKQIGDVYNLMHHAASVYAYYYVMSYSVYQYFANFRLMAEFSTPFVNNRWFLDVMGKKSSKYYILNGLVLTAVFFGCRILTMPMCWYSIYSIYGTEPYLRTGNIKYVLLISCSSLDILNVFWFYKLCKGAHRTLQKLDKNANKND